MVSYFGKGKYVDSSKTALNINTPSQHAYGLGKYFFLAGVVAKSGEHSLTKNFLILRTVAIGCVLVR